MTTIEALTAEFEHETKTTLRHLERLPDDRLGWRPHQKSFTAGGLGSHIVECVGWAGSIFGQDAFDFDPATFKPYQASSVVDLLDTFDARVADGGRAMAALGDEDLRRLWQLKVMGKVRVEKPKAAAFQGLHPAPHDPIIAASSRSTCVCSMSPSRGLTGLPPTTGSRSPISPRVAANTGGVARLHIDNRTIRAASLHQ